MKSKICTICHKNEAVWDNFGGICSQCMFEKENKIAMIKHDSDLLDKVLERVKEHHYLLSNQINSTDYGMFTVGIEQVIAELKKEVNNVKF